MAKKLTSREVFETLAPLSAPRSLTGVFRRDGSLCAETRTTGPSFVVWAVLVSQASPPRSVDDLVKAQVLDPELTRDLLDWLDTPEGRWVGPFLRWTEPACKWFLPSSRQLANWPSDAKLRDVWERTLVERLGRPAKPAKTTPEDAGQLALFGK